MSILGVAEVGQVWRRVGEEMLMGTVTVDVVGEGLGMGVRDWVVGTGEEVAVEAAVMEMASEEAATAGAMLAVVKVLGRWRVVWTEVAYFPTFGGKNVAGMMVGCKNVS